MLSETEDLTEEDDIEVLELLDGRKFTYQQITEACHGEPYRMSLVGKDAELVTRCLQIGIDSRLQICFCPERGDSYKFGERSITATEDSPYWKAGDKLVLARPLDCQVSPESLPVLLQRLLSYIPWAEPNDDEESDWDEAQRLAEDLITVLLEPDQ